MHRRRCRVAFVSLREITGQLPETCFVYRRGLPMLCKHTGGCYEENPRGNVDPDPLTFGLSRQGHNQNITILLSDPSSKHRFKNSTFASSS